MKSIITPPKTTYIKRNIWAIINQYSKEFVPCKCRKKNEISFFNALKDKEKMQEKKLHQLLQCAQR
jgi:hypothetical protein